MFVYTNFIESHRRVFPECFRVGPFETQCVFATIVRCTLDTFHAVFPTNYEAIQFAVYTWQEELGRGGGGGGGARRWWQVDWHWQRQVAGSLVA